MTIEQLELTNLNDEVKDRIIKEAKKLFDNYNTPLEDGIRIVYNAFNKPSIED